MDKKQPEAQERKFWKRLCALNRFSFFYMGGGVARASDKSGNWIEVHSAQEIVDDAECEVSALTARITELESQLAQRFDAADMATASAQGFGAGVASVSAGSDNGWLEAAVAWEVCASLHRQYCKGKDALFTTRQSDFVKHAENARVRASHGQAPAQQLSGRVVERDPADIIAGALQISRGHWIPAPPIASEAKGAGHA